MGKRPPVGRDGDGTSHFTVFFDGGAGGEHDQGGGEAPHHPAHLKPPDCPDGGGTGGETLCPGGAEVGADQRRPAAAPACRGDPGAGGQDGNGAGRPGCHGGRGGVGGLWGPGCGAAAAGAVPGLPRPVPGGDL